MTWAILHFLKSKLHLICISVSASWVFWVVAVESAPETAEVSCLFLLFMMWACFGLKACSRGCSVQMFLCQCSWSHPALWHFSHHFHKAWLVCIFKTALFLCFICVVGKVKGNYWTLVLPGGLLMCLQPCLLCRFYMQTGLATSSGGNLHFLQKSQK